MAFLTLPALLFLAMQKEHQFCIATKGFMPVRLHPAPYVTILHDRVFPSLVKVIASCLAAIVCCVLSQLSPRRARQLAIA